MSSQLPLLLALGLGAGIAGGGIATVLSPSNGTSTSTSLDDESTSNDELVALLTRTNERLDKIEKQVNGLGLQGGGSAVRESAAAAPQVDLADLKAELDAYMASLRNPAAAMPPHFEAWVEAAQDSIREREREERDAERDQREAERLEERLAEMQTTLGLDMTQMGQMRDTLSEATTKRDELFASMREQGWGNMSREDMRAQGEALRDATNTKLQSFLTPSQYETYQAEFAQQWGRGGPGGGGPGGGGNNNNGGGGGGRRGGGGGGGI